MIDPITAARAEIAWIDFAQCHDNACAMPGSFLQGYLAEHHPMTAAPVVTPSPVPEPGALPLLLAGLAVLGWVARRRVF